MLRRKQAPLVFIALLIVIFLSFPPQSSASQVVQTAGATTPDEFCNFPGALICIDLPTQLTVNIAPTAIGDTIGVAVKGDADFVSGRDNLGQPWSRLSSLFFDFQLGATWYSPLPGEKTDGLISITCDLSWGAPKHLFGG